MPASLRWRFPAALAVAALAAWYTFPLQQRISLGLDLQGGMHLVLRVDTREMTTAKDQDVTATAIEIIRNRIDQFGVREPLIQRQGVDHILVQLPGVTDRERALSLIGKTALLEFLLVSERQQLIEQALDGTVPAGYRLLEGSDGTPYLLETDEGLTGAILADAWVEPGELGLPEVSFRLTREGAKQFGRLTGTNINRRLAIVLDGVVQSAPTIQSRITDQGRITGQFSSEDAHDLAIILRAGALPAPIVVEEERTVGPSLGRDSIRSGLLATAIGGGLLALFVMGYYLLAGAVAIAALALNLLLILGGLGYFHATLTLPGIAGMILTLGMAVDANVLIYERIREELKAGRPLSLAIANGYDRAFSAIFDSNVTTLIAAFFLYWFGTGPIRGFAMTLGIGLLASFFTALFVTRILFDLLLGGGALKTLRMAQMFGHTRFDFIGKGRWCGAFSGIAIVIAIVSFVGRGDARYGIDFTGGLLQEYRLNRSVTVEEIRGALADVGLGDAVIQQFGEPTDWLIRTRSATEQEIQVALVKTEQGMRGTFADAEPGLVRLERVGPTVGAILRQKAWLAIAWSMLGILVYVALRFRHWDFGLAALIALVHDVIVAAGALCVTNREIDLVIVAALMTIAGFSVNDTIVIYDRVRENLRLNRKWTLREVINASVNQTLSRTILTSTTTLITVIVLFVVGGQVLRDFAFALIIGFTVGVYSTVYIASALVVWWRSLARRPA